MLKGFCSSAPGITPAVPPSTLLNCEHKALQVREAGNGDLKEEMGSFPTTENPRAGNRSTNNIVMPPGLGK